MKYCEFCGKQLENRESCSCSEASANSSKTAQKRKMFIIGGVVLAVVVVLAAVFAVTSLTAKIDPLNYVTINYSGFDTYGKADVVFDKTALIESIIGKEPKISEDYFVWYESYEMYSNEIDISCSDVEGLANGDIITVIISVRGKAADKINSAETTFTVQGLTELQTINVFEGVEVKFSGISGSADLELSLLSDDEMLAACDFTFDRLYDLSTGDVVVLSVDNVEAIAEKYGLLISPAEKEYIVSGLYEFLTDPEILPKDTIREFIDQFIAENHYESKWGFSYTEPVYFGTYFCVAKHEGFMIQNNKLMLSITYDEYFSGEYKTTFYYHLEFQNLVVSPDGSIYFTYDMKRDGDRVTDINSYLEELEEDYSVTKLQID